MAEWVTVARTDEIPEGEARCVEVNGNYIALYHVDGEFYATDDTCTHEEASLSEGFLIDGIIECPLHGSQFDVRTGEVLSLPAVLPLKTYPVRVEGDEIQIHL
jgi:3-phenylpropionate/trans-cinnamate dioxygenase ferredoxin subunit